jgi:hypothetical protein
MPNIEIQRQIVSELDAQVEILNGVRGMQTAAKGKIEKLLQEVWGEEK